MTATTTEVLMGLGSATFSFRPDGDVAPDINHHEHVHVYEGERLIHTFVVLTGKTGLGETFGGCGVDWWLGKESDGPVIEDREYISGRNKLSNGGFEDEGLLWRVDEDPLWVIRAVGSEPRTGTWAMALTAAPTADEVAQSDESYEARPGDLVGAECWIKRTTGTLGRLRLRVVFEGRFRPVNLLDAMDWTDTSLKPGDAYESGGDLVLGPVTKRQVLALNNYGFETGDLTHWVDDTPTSWVVEDDAGIGDLGIFEGDYAVTLPFFGTGARQLTHDTSYAVVGGERMFLQARVSAWAEDLVTHADGFVTVGALTYDTGLNPINHQTQVLGVDDNVVPGWATVSETFDVEEGQNEVVPYIRGTEVTVGKWAFDEIILSHLENNFATFESDTFTVHPGRTYRLMASVEIDEFVHAGSLKARITYERPDYPFPCFADSSSMEPDREGEDSGSGKLFSQEFTVPSGYTSATIQWIAKDVYNGAFRIRESSISFRDTDASTMWVDALTATNPASYAQLLLNTTAPDGVERFHVEIVAEQGDAGWRVDDVDVHRNESTSNAEDIVDDLLRDPDTLGYLIPPGTIHPAGLIEYDWHIRNLTDREALRHLSTSGLAGSREWKINPDPSLDWGTPEELFTDRTDIVLVDNDLILKDIPEAETDSTNQVTRVKVIGADRTPVGGQKRIITGQATAAPGDAVDWYGNPLARTRIVQDATIDTPDHAAGRADIELDTIGRQTQPVTAQLADYRIAGRFDVGDWIYIHSTQARLIDPANPVDRGGVTLFPARKRVLSRTRKLGAGYRVELRRFNGDTEDITDFIAWEPETSATVEFGDIAPAFNADQQGGDITVQFRRFRGSTGR